LVVVDEPYNYCHEGKDSLYHKSIVDIYRLIFAFLLYLVAGILIAVVKGWIIKINLDMGALQGSFCCKHWEVSVNASLFA
jgi:hypothetical protein